MNELNKKLAEWAGVSYKNFTWSLDACFKWLVPECFKRYGYINTLEFLKAWAGILLDVDDGVTDKSALAFCLAVEKLIDKGERNE